jgi:phospholipid/cholesterol/gamma-HCH transport system substrate-binding protein
VSDYEQKQRVRNIAVGIFSVIGICAFAWLVFKFGDLPGFVSKINSYNVYVQFAAAPGVQKDTPVRLCGYQVGRVTDVKAPEIVDERRDSKKTGRRFLQTTVVMSIDKKYDKIPSNVAVKLMARGLGSSYIDLIIDPNLPPAQLDPNRPETVFLADRIILQGATGVSSEFFSEESQKKLDTLVESLNVLIQNANDIIGDPNNKGNLKSSLANLTEATNQTTLTLKQVQSFFATAQQTSEGFYKITHQVRDILDKINTGQGSAGRFVNDARLYESLLETSQQLKVLFEQMHAFVKKMNEKGVKIQL